MFVKLTDARTGNPVWLNLSTFGRMSRNVAEGLEFTWMAGVSPSYNISVRETPEEILALWREQMFADLIAREAAEEAAWDQAVVANVAAAVETQPTAEGEPE